MPRKRAPLVGDPSYRALTLTARAVLRDLWDLAEDSPERGVLRGVAVTGRAGLVALVGVEKADRVREALEELVRCGWLEVSTPREDSAVAPPPRRRESAVTPPPRRRDSMTLDWTFLRFEEWNPEWVDSSARTREYRKRLKERGLPDSARAPGDVTDDNDRTPAADGDVTSRERHSRARAPRPRAEPARAADPPPPLEGSSDPRDRSDREEHHHHPRAGKGNGGKGKPPASRWLCFKCHHMHCDQSRSIVRYGACARCDCKRVGPFAGPDAEGDPAAAR